MKHVVLLLLIFYSYFSIAQPLDEALITSFERSQGKQTATYKESIAFYYLLSNKYKTVSIQTIGKSDGGHDMYVVYYSAKENKILPGYKFWDKSNDIVILVNNGIHPGEPDGVDASMMLIRDATMGKIKIPANVILAVIPIYNVGGALNRSCCSRANQNGPEYYGFRGNAKNLDLNRDFIKQDANETANLERIFSFLDPDLFIDNHVSDGADYQHVMTLLGTQHDKLGGAVGDYSYNSLTPMVYKDMQQKGYDIVPYVNNFDNTPETGWKEFYDLPRFSSGYAALLHTFAYVPETHMLKPFKQRVEATEALLQSFIKIASEHAKEIKDARAKDKAAVLTQTVFPLGWKVDTTKRDSILFMGYEAAYKPSEVSGFPRLFYNRGKPYTRKVAYFDHFIPADTVNAPKAYIIPKTWDKVINILIEKGAKMRSFRRDTGIKVTAYHIDDYETVPHPYESHYLHKNVQVSTQVIHKEFRQGDYIIQLDQPLKRYLIETLEPTAPDAFFAWNFFDGILQQKEYFSDYVFEDVAAKILEKDTILKTQLNAKKRQDTTFAKNGAAQLDFVYRHSEYMEQEYLQYPVFRVEE